MNKVLGLVLVGCFCVMASSFGATRYVSSESGADSGDCSAPGGVCASIQYAVDQSSSGDEIWVATYDVTLLTSNQCVYTGTGDNVIEITNAISLKIEGGYFYEHSGVPTWFKTFVPPVVDAENARRGLYVVAGDNDTNTIELLEFANGVAADGANIYASGGSLQLIGTPIHDGTATNGGGVYVAEVDFSVSMGSYSNLALPQMTGFLPIYSNTAVNGGGLYLDGGYPIMTTVGLMDNSASGNGGGVYINGGMPSVVGGMITENETAGYGGGIYLADSVARVGGMIITSNRADLGGGIYLAGPFALTKETATLIANNYIQDNAALAGKGGGIFFDGANVGVLNNVITGNSATNGAAGYLFASSPQFYQNTIADNIGDTALHVINDEGEGRWIETPEVKNPWPPYNVIVPAGSNFIAGIPIPSKPTLTNTIFSGHDTALYVKNSGASEEFLKNKVVMGYTLWYDNNADIAGDGTVIHDDDLYGDPAYTSKGTPPNEPTPYHLETNSPAIDTGTEVALTLPGTDLLLDIDAQLRPSGDGMDIGADEVVTDPFSVWFVPASISRTVLPGDVITNEHMLLNSGTQNDSYNIAISNDVWSGSVSPTVVSLESQTYTSVFVVINVPGGAVDGDTNITIVTAVSAADSNRFAVAVDTTAVQTNEPGTVRYVWQDSSTPGAPYTTSETAGHTIQEVVDVCVDGDEVLVYPGAYNEGGSVTPGNTLTNRVCITNVIAVTTLSDDVESTQIIGAGDPLTTNGPAAVRCVFMNTNAVVSGFTLTDGHTDIGPSEVTGGGVLLRNAGSLENCIVRANVAQSYGGGVALQYGGSVKNCLILYNIVVGAGSGGGGVFVNDAGDVDNCTVIKNSASAGGGVNCSTAGDIRNTIIFYNTASWRDNHEEDGTGMNYSHCATPRVEATAIFTQCITNSPDFVDTNDNFRLMYGSACIDSGTNISDSVTDDLDGYSRPIGAEFDIGCYEYNGAVYDSDSDGLVDDDELGIYNTSPTNTNTDGDYASDYEEMVADTAGSDSNDFFHIEQIAINSPVTVSFDSSASRDYTLIMNENLVDGIWTNVPGMGPRAGAGGADSFVVTNENPRGNYSVRVELP